MTYYTDLGTQYMVVQTNEQTDTYAFTVVSDLYDTEKEANNFMLSLISKGKKDLRVMPTQVLKLNN